MNSVPGWRRLAAVLLAATQIAATVTVDAAAGAIDPSPVPRADCGDGSRPEQGRQGRVSPDDVASGRAALGVWCNVQVVARVGSTGGYRVHRYVDPSGRECAYYDMSFVGRIVRDEDPTIMGVHVLDMSDPSAPVRTKVLRTPAMLSPWESLSLHAGRGLLGGVTGSGVTSPGTFDLYDLSEDCRDPVLRSSTPMNILGHEAAFSNDGTIFYATATQGPSITALDVADADDVGPLWVMAEPGIHGLSLSQDDGLLYGADLWGYWDPDAPGSHPGLTILDVSALRDRQARPQVPVVSRLTWDTVSLPQMTIPVTIGGTDYVIEMDEFAQGLSTDPSAPVGAARIIDVSDPSAPAVVSDLRLEVHNREHRASQMGDANASNAIQGYAGHYCGVPTRDDPQIVACSFILSGVRVFDIRDPHAPMEVAYYNAPRPSGGTVANQAMSSVAFVPERSEMWFTDGVAGFFVLRLTNGVWPR